MNQALRIASLSLSVGLGLVAFALSQYQNLAASAPVASLALPLSVSFPVLRAPESAFALEPRAFQARAAFLLDERRRRHDLSPLQLHSGLAASLERFHQSHSVDTVPLASLFDYLEAEHPEFQQISANLVFGQSPEDLLGQMSEWRDIDDARHSALALLVFEPSNSVPLACIAVLAHTLQPLRLPAPATESADFYDHCRRCGKGHGIALRNQTNSTLIIKCPHCRLPYNLIAVDSRGEWRRANQFLTGFQGIQAPSGITDEEKILYLWKSVTMNHRYQRDAQRIGGSDSWEFPYRTVVLKNGDCEDTSLLLADLLIAHGFDARVVLGLHQGEGHAWCVVRLGDASYLLESTNRYAEHARSLPRIDKLAFDYEPHCMFDRANLYFKDFEGWTGDYWSSQTWEGVSYAEETAKLPDLVRMGAQVLRRG